MSVMSEQRGKYWCKLTRTHVRVCHWVLLWSLSLISVVAVQIARSFVYFFCYTIASIRIRLVSVGQSLPIFFICPRTLMVSKVVPSFEALQSSWYPCLETWQWLTTSFKTGSKTCVQSERYPIRGGLAEKQRLAQALFCIWRYSRTIYIIFGM